MSRLRGWWATARAKRTESGQLTDGVLNADALLADDFTSPRGWQKLIQAANQFELIETERLAWKTFVALYPEDRGIGLDWAQALHLRQRDDEALVVAQNVLKHHPADAQALSLVRQISVAVTMQLGKLKNGGDHAPPSDSI